MNCACDKRDWCGCVVQFPTPDRICERCKMHQTTGRRTRIRKPAR